MSFVSDNTAVVLQNIADAALRSGRSPEDITLVAATKMNGYDAIQEAIAAGVTCCGENRVQEMLEKLPLDTYKGSELHFIGHLQKNKAKHVVGRVSLIQSVDSCELLSVIGALAVKRGLVQDVLIEINIGAEEAKSGISPELLPEVLQHASTVEGVRVRGLMAVPPICSDPEQNRPYFDCMHKLFVDNRAKKYDNVSMDFLSMGMSGDYALAVECGSNMVRVGTAIFGKRIYPDKP